MQQISFSRNLRTLRIVCIWTLLILISVAASAKAQVVEIVHDLVAAGKYPTGNLVQASDGYLTDLNEIGLWPTAGVKIKPKEVERH